MATNTNELEFSIIIPAYNEDQYIGQCLESVLSQDYLGHLFEVIVVDNGSSDGTRQVVQEYNGVELLDLPSGNVGAVRNHGAQHARGRYLVFIDADCLMDNLWLQRAHYFVYRGSATIYGGGVRLPEDPSWIEKYWLLEATDGPTLPTHLIGASILIPKTVFESLGRFEEGVTSGEDTALHMKAKYAGYNILIDRDLSVIHLGNAKTTKAFIARQKWHGENYFQNIESSVRDPMFFLIIAFFITLFLAITLILAGKPQNSIVFLILSLLIPTTLSAKRIWRSGIKFPKNICVLSIIYYVDILYIVGRGLGMILTPVKRRK